MIPRPRRRPRTRRKAEYDDENEDDFLGAPTPLGAPCFPTDRMKSLRLWFSCVAAEVTRRKSAELGDYDKHRPALMNV